MPFKRDFERRVNEDMAGEKTESSSSAKAKAREAALDHDSDDEELSEKHCTNFKDAPPPRFSTLFTTPPPLKAPTPPTPIFESYPRSRPRSRNGVFVPLPLLIIIAVLFLFESTVLFAYTVIGLYNTAPSKFLGLMNVPVDHDAAMCNCPAADHQPAQAPINFAPNFMMPQPGQPSQQATTTDTFTTTVTATPSFDISSVLSDMLATMSSSISTSTSTSSSSTTISSTTSTIDLQSQASQMASNIMSMMETMTTSTSTSSSSSSSEDEDSDRSTVFKTVNPTPTVSSTKYIYVNEEGSTETGPLSTVYSTKVVKAKRTSVAASGTGSVARVKRDAIPQPTSLVAMSLEDALAE